MTDSDMLDDVKFLSKTKKVEKKIQIVFLIMHCTHIQESKDRKN